MGWAHGQAWIEHTPFVGFSFGKAFTPATNVARPAIIEGQAFRPALARHHCLSGASRQPCRQGAPIARSHLRSPRHAAAGEWEEFDLDKALWTIPFKKLKQRKFREGIKELTSKPHFVPLSRQAVALLGDLKKLTGNRRYPFPDSRGGRSLSTNALEIAQEPWLSGRSLPRTAFAPARQRCSMPSASRSMASRCHGSPSKRLSFNWGMSSSRSPRWRRQNLDYSCPIGSSLRKASSLNLSSGQRVDDRCPMQTGCRVSLIAQLLVTKVWLAGLEFSNHFGGKIVPPLMRIERR